MQILNFTCENKGDRTYLTYMLDNISSLDTMTLGMMTNNEIKGLLHLDFSQINGQGICRFNISSKISMKQILSSPVNRNTLLGIFQGICDTLLSLDEFMISTDSIVLNTDYIYVSISDYDAGVVCLPILSKVNPVDNMGMFFKDILFSVQLESYENSDCVGRMINYINSNSVFSISEFRDLIVALKGNAPMGQVSRNISASVSSNVVNHQTSVSPVTPSVPVVTPTSPSVSVPTSIPTHNSVPTTPSVSTVPVVPIQQPVKTVTKVASSNNSEIEALRAQLRTIPEEDDISLFYLLQHYNSENNEKYKKAKEIKEKNAEINKKIKELEMGMPGVSSEKGKKEKKSKPAKANNKPSNMNVGYVIPGQDKIQSNPVSVPSMPSMPQTSVPKATTPVAPVVQTPIPMNVSTPPTMSVGNFGETTVLGGANTYGETTVLSASEVAAPSVPYLFRLSNNEKIYINKNIFKIGKDSSSCDYAIPNGAVSRSHATIYKKDNSFYLLDVGSTNHTYLNESMISPNQDVRLNDGDKVKFANEEYKFMIG